MRATNHPLIDILRSRLADLCAVNEVHETLCVPFAAPCLFYVEAAYAWEFAGQGTLVH